MVILDQSSFPLVHSDGDGGLLVLIGGEGLALLGWDERPFGDDFSHDSSDSLDSEGQWGGVDNDDVFGGFRSISTDDSSLNCCSESHSLIRVDSGIWFFSVEEVLH